jgi:hypothetical protein
MIAAALLAALGAALSRMRGSELFVRVNQST